MATSSRHRLRVAIIGAGYVAPYHLRALQAVPSVVLAAIADPDVVKAETLASQFSISSVARTLDDLANETFDVAHILTPPALHAPLAIEAMHRGAHVLVEKPMAETIEECDRMIAAARETGRILSINHSYRFDPVVLRALDLVEQGTIGEVLSVDISRSSSYAPYAGGPIPPCYKNGSYPFQDLGVHALYLLEAFLGSIRSINVHHRASARRPMLYFDEWRILADCEKGYGQVYMTWNNTPVQNELVVYGTRGNLYIDCYTQLLNVRKMLPAPMPITRMLDAGMSAWSNLWRVPVNTLRFVTGSLRPNPGIGVHIARFYEAIRNHTPAPIKPEDGRRIVELLAEPSARADEEKKRAFAVMPARTRPRILITGANGFLGGALLRRLQQSGESLRVLQRRPPGIASPSDQLHIMAGDIGEPCFVTAAMDGIELVYHVAAAMRGGREDFDCGTVWGTRNVVEACLRHGVKRLVYVSSLTVLDHAGRDPATAITEDSRCEPHPEKRGHYTRTKLVAEEIVLQAVKQRGLRAVILRPGHIFGPGANFPPSGSLALAGRWVVIGDGSRYVPFVYVEDAVDALILAAEHAPADGSIFHVVDSGASLSQREFINVVKSHSATPPKVVYIPRFVFMGLAVAVEMFGRALKREVPLSRYRARSLRPVWPCDVSQAQSRLRWIPRIGVAEGLRLTYASPSRGTTDHPV
jgi:predicted dehydrogenase/nucleoside-diphosphate-sugar epimerase